MYSLQVKKSPSFPRNECLVVRKCITLSSSSVGSNPVVTNDNSISFSALILQTLNVQGMGSALSIFLHVCHKALVNVQTVPEDRISRDFELKGNNECVIPVL